MFLTTVTNFIEKNIHPYFLEWDKTEELPRELFIKMGKAGLLGMLTPKQYGGLHLNYATYGQAIILIAQTCGAVGLQVAAHNSLTSQHINMFGNDEQKNKYLPKLSTGEYLGAWALTEPNASSDSHAMQTTAVKEGNHWLLNGNKMFITNGGIADVLVVIAKTDKGISAFLVEKNTAGFTQSKPLSKLGMKASNTTALYFNNCKIPEENLMGNEAGGFKQAMKILDGGRISIAALGLGIAKGAYNIAKQYAKTRQQFGKPIASNQAISFMLADMAVQTHAAETMLADACNKKENNVPCSLESAMCKLHTSELAVNISNQAVQILSGNGYLTNHVVEKHYRDAKLCTIGEGTSEIMRMVIAREVLK